MHSLSGPKAAPAFGVTLYTALPLRDPLAAKPDEDRFRKKAENVTRYSSFTDFEAQWFRVLIAAYFGSYRPAWPARRRYRLPLGLLLVTMPTASLVQLPRRFLVAALPRVETFIGGGSPPLIAVLLDSLPRSFLRHRFPIGVELRSL